MILAEMYEAGFMQSAEKREQLLGRNFVGCSAGESIRSWKNRGDNAVAARQQTAAFDVRLTTRVRQHLLQNFRAHYNTIGHARQCTSARLAES